MRSLAEVRLNGKKLGVLWKPPYRIEVTGTLKPSRNTLGIDVGNTWKNRLIGDASVALGKRIGW